MLKCARRVERLGRALRFLPSLNPQTTSYPTPSGAMWLNARKR
jgi:hypothetical protein